MVASLYVLCPKTGQQQRVGSHQPPFPGLCGGDTVKHLLPQLWLLPSPNISDPAVSTDGS